MQSQREFFGSILPSQGKPCIAWLVDGVNKKYFRHTVFESVEELCQGIETLDYRKHDYYFCVSTLKQKSVFDGKKDRIRIQPNTLLTRAFILDVDIRPEKDGYYTNKEDALAGVIAVRDAFSLPDPTIVDSGFGLHVYWPMPDGIDSDRWSRLARKFKKAVGMIAPPLVADGSRVSDSAGVLRIPNSFNLKSDPPRTVKIIQDFTDFIDLNSLENLLTRTVPDETTDTKVKLGTVITDTGPTELRAVVKRCNWVKEYIEHQETASEPEWYAMLGLVPYLTHTTKDGKVIDKEKLAHLISKKHPSYDPEKTYAKYIQASTAQSGPTTCARLAEINPDRCKGCPYLGLVKTPLQTVKFDKPATKEEKKTTQVTDEEGNKSIEEVTIPLPPSPYFRGEHGGVYIRKKVKKEEGWDEVIDRIYDYDMYPTKRFRTESTESEAMEIHLWLPKDGLKKFRLPAGHLADGKKLTQYLSDKGVVPEFNGAPKITKYLVDYIRWLQMQQSAEIEFSRFGWRDIFSADPKFILGDGYYDVNGILVPAGVAQHLKEASNNVTVSGTLEDWKKGFNLYNHIADSDPYILSIMLGFAAPLMPLTGYSGVMYNMVGDSAAGKSTALKVMTSVWGKPNESMLRVEDTDISIFNLIGYMSNVPISFDEVTKMDGDRLSTFVLAFTGGRGKMRANRDGQNKANDAHWDTIICSSSNVSLYDKLANARRGYSAEVMRVFELHVDKSHEENRALADRATRLLKENYGHAGRIYTSWLIPRIAKIQPLIDKATASIIAKGKLRNEERFWGALLACTLVGGKIARDVLHLHNYNIEGVIDRTLGIAHKVRESVELTMSDPVSTIAEFINANLNSIIRINNDQVDLASMTGAMNSIRGRLEYVNGLPIVGYISIQAIKEYCAIRKIDPAWLRRELDEAGVIRAVNTQKRLTAGTKLPKVNVKVWEIRLDHPKLSMTLEEMAAIQEAEKNEIA